jgi:hypothetical protein
MKMKRGGGILATAALLLCFSEVAYAVPFTAVTVNTSVGLLAESLGFFAEQDTGPLSVFGNGVTMSGQARVGPPGLGAVASVSSNAPADTVTGGTSAVAAQLALSDVTFTPVAVGPSPSTITTSLNLHLSGLFFATGAGGPPFTSAALVQIDMFAQAASNLGADNFIGSARLCVNQLSFAQCLPQGFVSDGLLEGYTGGDVILTTPEFIVPVSQPLSLTLQLLSTAFAGNDTRFPVQTGQTAAASADFLSTLSFPESGAVFNLPDEFTMNSPDGFIVDNGFVPPSDASVPVPGTWLIVSFGMLAMLAVRGRLRRQPASGQRQRVQAAH